MNRQRFEEELRKTLHDQRLSRNEKRALGEHAKEQERGAVDVMRSIAFDIARSEIGGDKRTRQILGWLEDVVKIFNPAEQAAGPSSGAFFSPGDEPLAKILGLLSAAQSGVDICVFTITDDRIAKAIIACHRRGAKVRVISDDDKAFDRGSDIDKLRDAGIAVRVDRSPHHMHHKFALFDRSELLTGSYNWTRSASAHNHENLIVTADARLVSAFADTFDRLWSELS
jgi:phosphatidylserine/phosphatidylglycerophosphate/cardiolipin synthase-like enzyme